MATPPRRIVPRQTLFITSRCVTRQFRFVPTEKVVTLIRFCLAVMVAKYEVELHEFVYMSNHLHFVLTMNDTRLPAFMRDLGSLISRNLNALRGTSGKQLEDHYNVVVVTGREKILDHCAYTLANPCRAHLVTRAESWRGVTSARLGYGAGTNLKRPKLGMWKNKPAKQGKSARTKKGRSTARVRYADRWKTPEQADLVLTRPPGFEHMSDEELRDEVMRRVVKLEDEAEKKRADGGRRVLGMRRVRQQRWNDYPRKPEDLLGPEPKVSGEDKWARIEYWQIDRASVAAHKLARARFIAGDRDVEFPYGTWQMRVQYEVNCAGPPG